VYQPKVLFIYGTLNALRSRCNLSRGVNTQDRTAREALALYMYYNTQI